MPRRPRVATGGHVFHVLNRAVGRSTIFETDGDYLAFLRVVEEAREQADCELFAFCVLRNHWHMVVRPESDDDLSQYMHWLTVTHTQRWHAFHGTAGTGPLYQGRFKSFPVQTDEHFYTVCRYVERNALRARLVRRAENWRWGSLWQRLNPPGDVTLDRWPVPYSRDWVDLVNRPLTEGELAAVRTSVKRGSPYGSDVWIKRTAKNLRLESTLRPRGRPRRQR